MKKIEIPTNSAVTHISVVGQKAVLSAGTKLHQLNLQKFIIDQQIGRAKTTINYSDIRTDGELVVSAEEQGSVLCSIVATHSMLKRFYGIKQSATVAKFTPDGYSVIAGSAGGKLILWDLATAQVSFACNLCSERITDIAFLDSERVAVSTQGGIHIIAYRIPTIEKGASEAVEKRAVGDYRISYIQLDSKPEKLFVCGQLWVCAGDFAYKVSIENYKVLSKSQQIVKGIASMSVLQNVVMCGCTDGTIRQLDMNLQNVEIVQNMQCPILSFYARSDVIIVGTSQSTITIFSNNIVEQDVSEREKYKKRVEQPRAGIDVLINVQSSHKPNSESTKLLYRANYNKALEYALGESFEQTLAVLRELECLGGRALDLGIGGLSDDGKIQLYKYVKNNLSGQWNGLLLRAASKSMYLSEGVTHAIVQSVAQELRTEVKLWTKMLDDGLQYFE